MVDHPILVAMSGGVDSSVVVTLLQEQGYRVIGATLRLHPASAEAAIADAKAVADALGIEHHVIDGQERFHQTVVAPFAAAYAHGQTPLPCAVCNRQLKFGLLQEAAQTLGCGAMATGHYVKRQETSDGPALFRATDHKRDQSYFLFGLTREQLAFSLFPLGDMADKEQTRALARARHLPVASKSDSQDICFLPNGGYADLVARLHPEANRPGDIVDESGTVLGQHHGIIHYTVGQRRGIGIGGGDALYVIHLDATNNRVVVGPKPALQQHRIAVNSVNWLGTDPLPTAPLILQVKVRSTRPPRPAHVTLLPNQRAEVILDVAEEGVAPGQACVFYDGDRLLGGGWID